MNKRYDAAKIVLIAVAASFLLNLLFGRYLIAKVSTLPLLNKWKLLSPQTPIVISTREETRVSETGEAVQAVAAIKSKISLVIVLENNILTVTGGALNLTTDGVFVSPASVFTMDSSHYFVALDDGRTAEIKSKTADPATGLVFFKADLNSVPISNIVSSADLKPGDKIFFVLNSTQTSAVKFYASYVTFSQSDAEKIVFDADRPSRSFGAQTDFSAASGQAIINEKGDLAGLWNGKSIISSDNIDNAIERYFANPAKISAPSFGFSYVMLNNAESSILNASSGALVKNVESKQPLSAAAKAGLLKGDIIVKFGDTAVNGQNLLEETLQKYKPGDVINLEVMRANKKINLKLQAEELK